MVCSGESNLSFEPAKPAQPASPLYLRAGVLCEERKAFAHSLLVPGLQKALLSHPLFGDFLFFLYSDVYQIPGTKEFHTVPSCPTHTHTHTLVCAHLLPHSIPLRIPLHTVLGPGVKWGPVKALKPFTWPFP